MKILSSLRDSFLFSGLPSAEALGYFRTPLRGYVSGHCTAFQSDRSRLWMTNSCNPAKLRVWSGRFQRGEW
jgi:hypothetical protein